MTLSKRKQASYDEGRAYGRRIGESTIAMWGLPTARVGLRSHRASARRTGQSWDRGFARGYAEAIKGRE